MQTSVRNVTGSCSNGQENVSGGIDCNQESRDRSLSLNSLELRTLVNSGDQQYIHTFRFLQGVFLSVFNDVLFRCFLSVFDDVLFRCFLSLFYDVLFRCFLSVFDDVLFRYF